MSKAPPTSLSDVHDLVVEMYRKGEINADIYYRTTLSVASEMALTSMEDALFLLRSVSAEYIRGILPAHMAGDEFFSTVVHRFAESLVAAGQAVPLNEEAFWFLRPGLA